MTTTHTYSHVTNAMKALNGRLAPGSECAQWGEYLESGTRECGVDVKSDAVADDVAPQGWAEFWLAVADENYALAEQLGDINPDWVDA